ncbi:MAG TPA: hypothetical protein VFF67_01110 [Thermoplasmata archaeon]|nr:hypothetical protein [Thermoplasmata archaeon]
MDEFRRVPFTLLWLEKIEMNVDRTKKRRIAEAERRLEPSRSPVLRAGRTSMGAATAALVGTLVVLLLPLASAAKPVHVTGSLVGGTSTVISVVTKGNKTYTTSSDVFQFSGGMSGNCTGTDTVVNGIGPNGTFGGDKGTCTLVGSVAGANGTMFFKFASPVGFEPNASDKISFRFSGSSGTGGLAGALLIQGLLDSSNNYTAEVRLG